MAGTVPVTYRKALDIFTATSIGTSTAKTLLNGGVALTTPDSAQAILGLTPVVEPQTLTAGQSELTLFELDSNTVSLKPKQIMVQGAMGGLGTFASAMHPVQKAIPIFKRFDSSGVKTLQLYGTAAVANTSAPLATAEIMYSLDPIDSALLERFYVVPSSSSAPTNFGTTSTGTAAAQVTGGSMTISTGSSGSLGYGGFLEFAHFAYQPGTVAASNSLAGYMTISSNDILGGEPIKILGNPIVAALGTAVSMALPQQVTREEIHRPIKATANIQTAATFDIAPTNAGIFCGGVGYTIAP